MGAGPANRHTPKRLLSDLSVHAALPGMERTLSLDGILTSRGAGDGLRRLCGLVALALVVALVGFGLSAPPRSDPRAEVSDLQLYARIIDRVRDGQPYDAVVVKDLRAVGGAVRPFVTVRPPLLAMAMAALPDVSTRVLSVRLLAVIVLAAWALRWRGAAPAAWYRWPLLAALSSGLAMALAPQAYLMHEVWAGLLIALSLALRRREQWLAAVAVGTAAALIRELAAPFLLVMTLTALLERRTTEALGWLAGLAVFALALARHAAAVHALLLPTDPASPGWLVAGGWPFVLHAASWNLFVLFLAPQALALALPLAMLGLASWRDELGRRVALTVLGYLAGFAVVGRAENFYWGLIIAPLWPMGLVMAPAGLALMMRWIRNADAPTPPARADPDPI